MIGVIIKVFKKDVNKALLLLVLVPLILFVWFSNYYYASLKNITIEYNKTKTAGNVVERRGVLINFSCICLTEYIK